jgi:DNA segregation ATPase FtsK/SpoIIIE-like protein
VANKGKALTARKERALTKSQHTGGLIDQHLEQIVNQTGLDPKPDESLYKEVEAFVIQTREASMRFVCRKFGMDCVQARTMFDQMEETGVVKMGLEGKRYVLPPAKEASIELNGGDYFGELLNGSPHGFGALRYSDGEKIVGEWERGQSSGWGIVIFPDGHIYDGDVNNTMRHGFGIELISDGEVFGIEKAYVGNWEDDVQHGSGLYTVWKWEQDEHVFQQFKQEWRHGELVSSVLCEDETEGGEDKSYSGPLGLDDPLYHRAVSLVVSRGSTSISGLYRLLMINRDRAIALIEAMEKECIIGPYGVPVDRLSLSLSRREILWGRVSDESAALCGIDDPLYQQTSTFVIETGKTSIASVQRRFRIGYERAARMIQAMEAEGMVGPFENGKRQVNYHEGN